MTLEEFPVSEFTSSSDKVASIDYLLTKIFECLPLKSLVRFELVSKQWFSLITDPKFSPLLKPRHASALFLIPSKLQDEPFSCEVDFLPLDGKNQTNTPFTKIKSVCESIDVKILHSCNGLLLCSNPRASGGDTNYFIFNPTTKQIKPLCRPSDGPYGSWMGIRGLYLAYDPLKSPHYKVIGVWRFAGDLLFKILIYSSMTRSWSVSESDEYFFYSSKAHFDKGPYWNGAIHWLCDTDRWLYFDIDQEKLNTMPPPPNLDHSLSERSFVYFGESSDHLHVVEDYKLAAFLYVYKMKRDYSGWVTKYKVSLESIAKTVRLRYPTEYGDVKLLSIVCGEKEEDSCLVLQVCGKKEKREKCVVRYDLKYEASCVIVDFDSSNCGWYDAFPYIESLASVGSGNTVVD